MSQTKGEVEAEGKVLVIRRIHVEYSLKMEMGKSAEAQRAHEVHADNCPVARSIRDGVDITTSLVIESL